MGQAPQPIRSQVSRGRHGHLALALPVVSSQTLPLSVSAVYQVKGPKPVVVVMTVEWEDKPGTRGRGKKSHMPSVHEC